MARLNVEACTAEWTVGDLVFTLLVAVSVSRADNGVAVSGLKAENFRLASSIGPVKDFNLGATAEWKWEPDDVEPSGCYQLQILQTPGAKFVKGERYVFGIQVRTFGKGGPAEVIDQGQTIIQLISTGT